MSTHPVLTRWARCPLCRVLHTRNLGEGPIRKHYPCGEGHYPKPTVVGQEIPAGHLIPPDVREVADRNGKIWACTAEGWSNGYNAPLLLGPDPKRAPFQVVSVDPTIQA